MRVVGIDLSGACIRALIAAGEVSQADIERYKKLKSTYAGASN